MTDEKKKQEEEKEEKKTEETVEEAKKEAEKAEESAEEAKEEAEEAKEAAEEATEAAEKAEETTEEFKEAAKEVVEAVEEVKEESQEKPEPKKEEPKPAGTEPSRSEPTGKFKNLIKDIESLSVVELAELVKTLEERFGVSAAAPVAAGPSTGAAEAAPAEEKSIYTVVLAQAGANKIGAIKAVREINPALGLKEAKDLVEGTPKTVKENIKKEEAEETKKKLEEAGCTVELK